MLLKIGERSLNLTYIFFAIEIEWGIVGCSSIFVLILTSGKKWLLRYKNAQKCINILFSFYCFQFYKKTCFVV